MLPPARRISLLLPLPPKSLHSFPAKWTPETGRGLQTPVHTRRGISHDTYALPMGHPPNPCGLHPQPQDPAPSARRADVRSQAKLIRRREGGGELLCVPTPSQKTTTTSSQCLTSPSNTDTPHYYNREDSSGREGAEFVSHRPGPPPPDKMKPPPTSSSRYARRFVLGVRVLGHGGEGRADMHRATALPRAARRRCRSRERALLVGVV